LHPNTASLKKYAIIIIMLGFAGDAFSQAILRIVANRGEPLSYATIANITKKKLYSADNEGLLKLEADPQDSIEVTYTGFISRGFRYTEMKYAVITLDKNPSLLELVVVKDCEKKKKQAIKNFERKGFLSRDTIFYWSFPNDKGKYAVKIKSPEPKAVLTNLSFWTERVRNAPESTAYAPFMITFYEVDESTGLPGEALPVTPVVYFPKKTGRQTLKLDSLHLHIPDSGLYISFQYILDQNFNWSYPARLHCSSCPDMIITGYGAELKFVKGGDWPSAAYGFFNGRWSPMQRNMAIQLEVTVSYCTEE
jgi:hypothetical protein